MDSQTFWTALLSMGGGVVVSVIALHLLIGKDGILRTIVDRIAVSLDATTSTAVAIRDSIVETSGKAANERRFLAADIVALKKAMWLSIRADRRLATTSGDTETLRMLDAAAAILGASASGPHDTIEDSHDD